MEKLFPFIKDRKKGGWRAPMNDSGELVGYNDLARVSFGIRTVHYLVRETIQNSLDARRDDAEGAVIVSFQMFDIPREKFPGREDFQNILERCFLSNRDDKKCREAFARALEVIKAKRLSVLRISDFRTRGLEGALQGEKGSLWSGLVKEQGFSVQKEKDAGGSFGIGKAVVYSCSELRTAFFASMDKDGVESYTGVAKLVSYEDAEDRWTTGTVYYSDENKKALIDIFAMDPAFRRRTSGTDIFVMGLLPIEGLEQEMIRAVLDNFLLAIWLGNLEVEIGGQRITKGSIALYAEGLPVEKPAGGSHHKEYYEENRMIQRYARMLLGEDEAMQKVELEAAEYGAKYGFPDGAATLFLTRGEGLNRRILMSRHIGMKLFEQKGFPSGIDFTGIFLIRENAMGQAFRRIEVPSHDAWEPGVLQDAAQEKRAKEMYAGLRKYLKEKVRACLQTEDESGVDAFGAGDFLPDVEEEAVRSSLAERRGKRRETLGCRIKKVKKKKDVATATRLAPLHARSLCLACEKGRYRLGFIAPRKAERVRLELFLAGEQASAPVRLLAASLSGRARAKLEKFEGNVVYLQSVAKGAKIFLDYTIDYHDYCLLEVKYIEDARESGAVPAAGKDE